MAAHSVDRLVEARGRLVYNFGHASEVAAEQLVEIYRNEVNLAGERPRTLLSKWLRRRVSMTGGAR